MKEYLSITYREKINSTATPADDIEGILYKFIPSGELSRIIERHM
jgi:hypothetical protein